MKTFTTLLFKISMTARAVLFAVIALVLPAFVQANEPRGLSYNIRSSLNPNLTTVESFIEAILNVLLVLSVPIIIICIIFAGFTYVTAQGNPEKIKTANRSLTYALIGAVLILGAVALSGIIAGLVNSFRT